jgi:hypothetical protein
MDGTVPALVFSCIWSRFVFRLMGATFWYCTCLCMQADEVHDWEFLGDALGWMRRNLGRRCSIVYMGHVYSLRTLRWMLTGRDRRFKIHWVLGLRG